MFKKIPEQLQLLILSFLSASNACDIKTINKRTHQLASHPALWKHFLKNDFASSSAAIQDSEQTYKETKKLLADELKVLIEKLKNTISKQYSLRSTEDLDKACQIFPFSDTEKKILRGADIDLPHADVVLFHTKFLAWVIYFDLPNLTRLLCHKCDKSTLNSLLINASMEYSVNSAQILIDLGADVNGRVDDNDTPNSECLSSTIECIVDQWGDEVHIENEAARCKLFIELLLKNSANPDMALREKCIAIRDNMSHIERLSATAMILKEIFDLVSSAPQLITEERPRKKLCR